MREVLNTIPILQMKKWVEQTNHLYRCSQLFGKRAGICTQVFYESSRLAPCLPSGHFCQLRPLLPNNTSTMCKPPLNIYLVRTPRGENLFWSLMSGEKIALRPLSSGWSTLSACLELSQFHSESLACLGTPRSWRNQECQSPYFQFWNLCIYKLYARPSVLPWKEEGQLNTCLESQLFSQLEPSHPHYFLFLTHLL